MTNREAIDHIKDVICESNTTKPEIVTFELEKVAMRMAIEALKREDADGCVGCAFESTEEWEMPCAKCKRNCKDYWRKKA